MGKKICVDFDGVIHSYTSGWRGAEIIPDPPVPGAIDWLRSLIADERLYVMIYSSRSKEPGAIEAMRTWLQTNGLDTNGLAFPVEKPGAFLTIDDRAICFRGKFPSKEEIHNFKTWMEA